MPTNIQAVIRSNKQTCSFWNNYAEILVQSAHRNEFGTGKGMIGGCSEMSLKHLSELAALILTSSPSAVSMLPILYTCMHGKNQY